MKDRQHSARSSGRRSRGNDSYREDLESVRSLNDWEPTPRRREEEAGSARQAPAPALDLSKLDNRKAVNGIRGGKPAAPEVQQQYHQDQRQQQQQQNQQSEQRLLPPSSPLKLQKTAVEREKHRRTQQQNLQDSRERQLKIHEYASRARASDAIVPNVKTELNERERWDAEIQTQVMEPLYHRELEGRWLDEWLCCRQTLATLLTAIIVDSNCNRICRRQRQEEADLANVPQVRSR